MIRRMILDRTAAGAAEFALVLPLLILFLLGIIDGGRYLWEVNKAEKATQAGARVAIVTDLLTSGLVNQSYVGQTVGSVTLGQGDRIPAAALGSIRCTKPSSVVTCAGTGTYPAIGTVNTASFDRIVQRMQFMKQDVAAANVSVTYRGSGLGFAGDPNGMEIAPLVTVELSNIQFRPIFLFNAVAIDLPPFRTTLTAEDSSGSQSN